jgi:hypothetical protein
VCTYNWIVESNSPTPGVITLPAGQFPEPQAEAACSAALGSTPFSVYASRWIQSTLSLQPPGCDNNKAEFCRWPARGSFTTDGKFGVAYASEGHDNLLGNWVETKSRYLIFSVAQRADVGQISVPTRDSVQAATSIVGARDFLLLISNGTHLDVYELRD